MIKLTLIVLFLLNLWIQFNPNLTNDTKSNIEKIELIGSKWGWEMHTNCIHTIEFEKNNICKWYDCEFEYSCKANYFNQSFYGNEESPNEGDTLIVTETDACNPNSVNIIDEMVISFSKIIVKRDYLIIIETSSIVVSRNGEGIIRKTEPKKINVIYKKIK